MQNQKQTEEETYRAIKVLFNFEVLINNIKYYIELTTSGDESKLELVIGDTPDDQYVIDIADNLDWNIIKKDINDILIEDNKSAFPDELFEAAEKIVLNKEKYLLLI